MSTTSKQGQWLGDIAVREAGAIEAVVEMAIMSEQPITETVDPGSKMGTPTPINRRVMNYYQTNAIYPATTASRDDSSQGIGSMAIEISFIVS
jgi:hypothetical protein